MSDLLGLSPEELVAKFYPDWRSLYDELPEPDRSTLFWRLAASGKRDDVSLAVGLTEVPPHNVDTALRWLSALKLPEDYRAGYYSSVALVMRSLAEHDVERLRAVSGSFCESLRSIASVIFAARGFSVELSPIACEMLLEEAQRAFGENRLLWRAAVEQNLDRLEPYLAAFAENKRALWNEVFGPIVPALGLDALAKVYPLLDARPAGLDVFDRFTTEEVLAFVQHNSFDKRGDIAVAFMLSHRHGLPISTELKEALHRELRSAQEHQASFFALCVASADDAEVADVVASLAAEPSTGFRLCDSLLGLLPEDLAAPFVQRWFDGKGRPSNFWGVVSALIATNMSLAVKALAMTKDPAVVRGILSRIGARRHPNFVPQVVALLGASKPIASVAEEYLRTHLVEAGPALREAGAGREKKLRQRCQSLLADLDKLEETSSFGITVEEIERADDAQACAWFAEHGTPFFAHLVVQPNFLRTPHARAALSIANANSHNAALIPMALSIRGRHSREWSDCCAKFHASNPDEYRRALEPILEDVDLESAVAPILRSPREDDFPVIHHYAAHVSSMPHAVFEKLGEDATEPLIAMLELPLNSVATQVAAYALQRRTLDAGQELRVKAVRDASKNKAVRKLLRLLVPGVESPIRSDEEFAEALTRATSRIPKWLKLVGVTLRTRTGRKLTKGQATKIASLLREETGAKGSDAQRLLAYLEPADVDNFGALIYESARRGKKKNDLWAIHQTAFTYSDARMNELLGVVNDEQRWWRAYPPLKALLSAALWRGGRREADWFAHYLVQPTSRVRGHALTALWGYWRKGQSTLNAPIKGADAMKYIVAWWKNAPPPPDAGARRKGEFSLQLTPKHQATPAEKKGARKTGLRLLETMMVEALPVSRDVFLSLLEAPLFRSLAEGLVWECGETTFTIDDGGAVDVDYSGCDIAGEPITLMHPTNSAAAKWADRLAASEVFQPFEQLGRSSFDETFTNRYAEYGISSPWAHVDGASARYFLMDDCAVLPSPTDRRFTAMMKGEEVEFRRLPARVRFEALREYNQWSLTKA